MPRQLPWKVGTAAKQTPPRPKPAASPARSHRPTPTPKAESTSGSARKPRRSLALTTARSPSTSPPPEPLKEEFMIEGIEHDDKYRMVEDEFLAVAGEFTRHLHAAEYQRLKGLANSENAEAIQSISRPVTGEMTDLVRRRHAALDTASRQRRGIAKVLGKRAARGAEGSDEDETHRRPATSLQGLMNSPRRQAVPLTSVVARPGSVHGNVMDASPSRRRPSTPGDGSRLRDSRMLERNDRHFTRTRSEPTPDTYDDDDDDLDGQPSWPLKLDLTGQKQTSSSANRQSSAPRPPTRSQTEPTTANTLLMSDSRRQSSTPAIEDGDAHMNGDGFFARLRARRAEQRRRRQTQAQDNNNIKTETQSAAVDSIPFI